MSKDNVVDPNKDLTAEPKEPVVVESKETPKKTKRGKTDKEKIKELRKTIKIQRGIIEEQGESVKLAEEYIETQEKLVKRVVAQGQNDAQRAREIVKEIATILDTVENSLYLARHALQYVADKKYVEEPKELKNATQVKQNG